MPIRVLEVIRQGEVGGGESHVIDLVNGLRLHSDIEPIVLAFSNGPMIENLTGEGVRCHVIPSARAFDAKAMKEVRRLIKSEGINLVHAHGSRAAANVIPLCRVMHLPCVYTVHGWSFHEGQSRLTYWLREQSERLLCHEANRVICVSQSNLATGINAFSLSTAKTTVIENGINLTRFNADASYPDLRSTLGFSQEDFVVAFICRITEQKGPMDFVIAVQEAASRDPHIKALMVGDGDMAADVDSYISSHGLQQVIRRQPFRSDVPALLANADIFCLPSLWEGLSIAMLEAMAMRKPMVVTLTDGARDIITNEQNAIVVPPRQPQALAEAFVRCAADSNLCCRLGRSAYELVRQRFDSQRVSDSVAQIYKELASCE
ncbi:MAG: glycosyltransferase [Bacteroidaceae bacterium]|nr:glycosyltransferase [Bacteroidaceae bacterium]